MIKGVISGSPSVNVSGGYMSYPSFSMNSNNPVIGMMRFNTYNQCTEVFDGSSWYTMTAAEPMVSLTASAETAIAWATRKMDEEAEWKKLAEISPVVAIALENLNKAKEQLTVIAHLSREYETTS